MSDKRRDYLSWDEYFMGVAMLSGMRSKDPGTQVGCCIVSQDNKIYLWDITDFRWGVPMMLFHGQEMVRILWKQNMFILRTAS